jgi:mRNA interferase YafQ
MKYTILRTNQFKRSFKKCLKRGLDVAKFEHVLQILSSEGVLPNTYRPHKLSGNYAECWECHICADWLLIWKQNDTELVLLLLDTGSHSDIFG